MKCSRLLPSHIHQSRVTTNVKNVRKNISEEYQMAFYTTITFTKIEDLTVKRVPSHFYSNTNLRDIIANVTSTNLRNVKIVIKYSILKGNLQFIEDKIIVRENPKQHITGRKPVTFVKKYSKALHMLIDILL